MSDIEDKFICQVCGKGGAAARAIERPYRHPVSSRLWRDPGPPGVLAEAEVPPGGAGIAAVRRRPVGSFLA